MGEGMTPLLFLTPAKVEIAKEDVEVLLGLWLITIMFIMCGMREYPIWAYK